MNFTFTIIWAAVGDLVQILVLVIFVLVPTLVQAYKSYAEQKQREKISAEKRDALSDYATQQLEDYNNPVEVSVVRKEKKKSKSRQSLKSSQVESPVIAEVVVPPVLVTRTVSNYTETAATKPADQVNTTASDIFQMFQNPVSMRQAIVISEIMKRPEF